MGRGRHSPSHSTGKSCFVPTCSWAQFLGPQTKRFLPGSCSQGQSPSTAKISYSHRPTIVMATLGPSLLPPLPPDQNQVNTVRYPQIGSKGHITGLLLFPKFNYFFVMHHNIATKGTPRLSPEHKEEIQLPKSGAGLGLKTPSFHSAKALISENVQVPLPGT